MSGSWTGDLEPIRQVVAVVLGIGLETNKHVNEWQRDSGRRRSVRTYRVFPRSRRILFAIADLTSSVRYVGIPVAARTGRTERSVSHFEKSRRECADPTACVRARVDCTVRRNSVLLMRETRWLVVCHVVSRAVR